MRSSVRSGTGVLCHSLGFSRSVRLSKDPAESTGLWRYFSTRPCPWLRTERFVGSVGRQPEQITLPLDRRSASPSLVALQRAIFQSQGTSTMPPSVTQRKRSGRPVSGFPNRYGIPSRLRFARHHSYAVVASPGVLLRLRTDSPMCKGCSHGTLPLVNSPGSRSSTRYYHQDLRRRRLQAGLHPDPSAHIAATFLLSEA